MHPSYKTTTTQNKGCLICFLVILNSVEETLKQMQQVKVDGTYIFDVIIDFLNNFNPNSDLVILLKERPLPIPINYKPMWEGGEYEGDEETHLDVLYLAMELDVDYVDVELQVENVFIKIMHDKKSRICDHSFKS